MKVMAIKGGMAIRSTEWQKVTLVTERAQQTMRDEFIGLVIFLSTPAPSVN
jgi:hypothetical protein